MSSDLQQGEMHLQERLQKYFVENDVKMGEISIGCRVCRLTLSRIFNGAKNCSLTTQLKIDHFLKSKGY
jgi:hypothetical protein